MISHLITFLVAGRDTTAYSYLSKKSECQTLAGISRVLALPRTRPISPVQEDLVQLLQVLPDADVEGAGRDVVVGIQELAPELQVLLHRARL